MKYKIDNLEFYGLKVKKPSLWDLISLKDAREEIHEPLKWAKPNYAFLIQFLFLAFIGVKLLILGMHTLPQNASPIEKIDALYLAVIILEVIYWSNHIDN